MEKVVKTLNLLKSQNLLEGNFLVDEPLIEAYQVAYGSGNQRTSSNKRFNAKLAALNLIRYKIKFNKVKPRDISEGWVYVVSNPAWPNTFKVGKTYDIEKRLSQLNVGSPFKDFKVEMYRFSTDVSSLEKALHMSLKPFQTKGEWFTTELSTITKAFASVA